MAVVVIRIITHMIGGICMLMLLLLLHNILKVFVFNG